MKKIVLSLIFILNFSELMPSPDCCAFYSIPEKVKGGYRKCEVFCYNNDELFFWKNKRIDEIYYYDSLGNRIEEVKLFNENTIFYKNEFIYNNKGKIIEGKYKDFFGNKVKLSFGYDSKDSLVEVTNDLHNYKNEKQIHRYDDVGYDSKDSLVELYEYLHNDQNKKQIYIYDENGNKIEEIHYNTNGHSNYHAKHIYDNKRNLIETNYINKVGTISNKIVFEYDSNNNQIEYRKYSKFGSLYSNSKSWYNKKNELIEEINYDAKNNITSHFKYTYKYNDDGVIIKKIAADQLKGIEFIYLFDDYGNNTGYKESYSFFSRGGKWTRKYDEFGNVTEYIIYRNPKDMEGGDTFKVVYIYSK